VRGNAGVRKEMWVYVGNEEDMREKCGEMKENEGQ
jgi:hypothetical protein